MLLKLLPSSLPIKWSVSTSQARCEHRPIVSLQIPPVHLLLLHKLCKHVWSSKQLSADTALHLLSFPHVDTWPSSERVNPYDKDACQGVWWSPSLSSCGHDPETQFSLSLEMWNCTNPSNKALEDRFCLTHLLLSADVPQEWLPGHFCSNEGVKTSRPSEYVCTDRLGKTC